MESETARRGDSEVTRQNSLDGKAKQFRNILLIILFAIVAIFYLISDVTPTTLGWYTLVPTFFTFI